jgi:glycosyltransferase involved in cell wall biosynthesis
MSIKYITNIPYTDQSGGGSGVNNDNIIQLKKSFDINLSPPINPGCDTIAKLKSIFLKQIGVKRNYHFFSERRLKWIERQFYSNKNSEKSDAYFFHGFTQWIKTKPNKPYFCFNDACFATYVSIYNNIMEFNPNDLKRIYNQEANWLSNASAVFFRSQWALEETKKQYNLSGGNFHNVGVGGFIDIPLTDQYMGGYNFLFISREFIPKGGLVAVEALKKVRIAHPDAKLWIVGQCPPENIVNQNGIEYKGFLNKSISKENAKLIDIFSKSFALVHPTLKDTNTLVINELAYYGCPSIASNRFAIPEYLLEGKTGFLLNDPKDSNELAAKMCLMIENSDLYNLMRTTTRENALSNNTWDHVGNRISKVINLSF